jgi:sugar lactone lactonase YvrE
MRHVNAIHLIHVSLAVVALPLVAGCGPSDTAAAARWSGTLDTLPSGIVAVHNAADPVWTDAEGWRVEEELRIGTLEGTGPDVFGRILTMAVDPAGRMWVFESQAQELRVFDAAGEHVRTIGRQGGGPGEFAQAVRVEQGPNGHMWVMDPQNNRISVFDTAGNYVEAKPAAGGFIMIPWPGRFDDEGRYYAPIPRPGGERFHIGMVRYDESLSPIDTLDVPTDPIERASFDLTGNAGSFIRAAVPYQGSLTWRLSPAGTIWAMLTDDYRLFELSPEGDTLRTITRAFTPLPVTPEDREQASENLKWFTDQGGRIDVSKLPATKPAATSFFFDDEGNLWVERVTANDVENASYDVFDSIGRFLGTVDLPMPLLSNPQPIVRDGLLYGVTRDELDVPYVVRARIVKP